MPGEVPTSLPAGRAFSGAPVRVPPRSRRGTSLGVRLSVFSTKPYDRHFLSLINDEDGRGHELLFFDARLEEATASLAAATRPR